MGVISLTCLSVASLAGSDRREVVTSARDAGRREVKGFYRTNLSLKYFQLSAFRDCVYASAHSAYVYTNTYSERTDAHKQTQISNKVG